MIGRIKAFNKKHHGIPGLFALVALLIAILQYGCMRAADDISRDLKAQTKNRCEEIIKMKGIEGHYSQGTGICWMKINGVYEQH